ncbi:tRNA uridine-5-carboxymethylaminomethyl(34) synthesis GTPase MnmE [Aquisalimonas sp. 2447]|uniref:tRNA uridine-5-carboxymethylaminomethyl(34) synthesis GTPase MnmE n=1 Tax=Aquisalimonas sp. 2447 TaxID=2740807 RepID=UPI0014326B04|nr:tRNA uridine-5-carboxymethylaminomethyl(34) synthesis GTPase MnmE [Aquisalimonas sp. 2447]QIT57050.1 tRNA uridine-5-carboxymethylaminomethyl(34) synthesis GTPase MnmE [Aquisalimonas sp. 2447]
MTDTICAVATPPGQGGVGIVRLSGPAAAEHATSVVGTLPEPRRGGFRRFRGRDGDVLDEGLVLWFPGPDSFTGEDVVEFQGHGGPVVMDRLLQRLTGLGCRLARPGEFSQRAFLNGRMDLTQAEAVADLIAAGSEAGARAAMASLHGAFSREVQGLSHALMELRVYVEAAIDFPDEEIDFLGDGEVAARLQDARQRLQSVTDAAGQGRLLRDGMTVVIAGRPNAGKSSLLNALADAPTAIVTAVAGTTRDILREQIQIDGMPLHVVDTAGLRETEEEVEQEGIRRAWRAIDDADRVLLVVDDCDGVTAADEAILARLPVELPVTVVRNKADLSGAATGLDGHGPRAEMVLSALSGAGMDGLREHLKECMGYSAGEGGFIARRRHLDALRRADQFLQDAAAQLHVGAGELMAEELRRSQDALGEITGAVSTEDLLGEIFSSFCIGK